MDKKHVVRSQVHLKARKSKPRTNKILDRITFNPKKHKQKRTKELRQKLQQKTLPPPTTRIPPPTLKFGSINLNGLDLETSWAVEQLLTTRGFDVSIAKFKVWKNNNIYSLGTGSQWDLWQIRPARPTWPNWWICFLENWEGRNRQGRGRTEHAL